MKIGLIDVDGHRWPNLCLMKLSACHKAQGADVEWWSPKGRYDLVYKSRVFTDTYSKDRITVTNADKLICGGTGYGPGQNLPDISPSTTTTTAWRPEAVPMSSPFLSKTWCRFIALNNGIDTRIMFLTWQQPDSTAAALNKFCSICTPNGVYTEFGIDPLLGKRAVNTGERSAGVGFSNGRCT